MPSSQRDLSVFTSSSLTIRFHCRCDTPSVYFTENETNTKKVFCYDNGAQYTKDGIHRKVVGNEEHAVREGPGAYGTKMSVHYVIKIPPGSVVDVVDVIDDNWYILLIRISINVRFLVDNSS